MGNRFGQRLDPPIVFSASNFHFFKIMLRNIHRVLDPFLSDFDVVVDFGVFLFDFYVVRSVLNEVIAFINISIDAFIPVNIPINV